MLCIDNRVVVLPIAVGKQAFVSRDVFRRRLCFTGHGLNPNRQGRGKTQTVYQASKHRGAREKIFWIPQMAKPSPSRCRIIIIHADRLGAFDTCISYQQRQTSQAISRRSHYTGAMFLHHLRHLRKGRAAQRSLAAAAMGVSVTVFAIVRNTQEQENLEERVEASPVDWWTTPQFGDVFARQHLLPRPCLCDSGSFLSQQRSILEARCRNLTKRITDTTSHGSLESAYRVKWDAPLGEGGFGAVYAATNRATGEAVACKKICKTYTDDIGFQREMEAFLHLRSNGGHPNIIRLRENFDEGGDYYLIMDLISGGEMFDHLINK